MISKQFSKLTILLITLFTIINSHEIIKQKTQMIQKSKITGIPRKNKKIKSLKKRLSFRSAKKGRVNKLTNVGGSSNSGNVKQ